MGSRSKCKRTACTRFLLSRFEPVYFQELSHPPTKFKRVTIEQIIDHIETKYPAEPEEIELQEALLREDWDTNSHIENNIFQTVREGSETFQDI
jgi:hypothetical protein